MNDLKFAIRQLVKNPGFTTVAVLSLALGIGAGTAIFSLVNAILLSSLPVPNPHQLRVINWSGTDRKMSFSGSGKADGPGRMQGDSVSYPLFLALREQCAPQADLFAYARLGITAQARHDAFRAQGLMVSDNFFFGLGARPLLGRLLGADDEHAEAAPAVVISYRWWERQFDLDPGALGQSVNLNGHSFSVVGVLPREFPGVHPGARTEFYVSMSAQPKLLPGEQHTSPDHWWTPLMARLKPGVRDAQLKAALSVVFLREAENFMKQPRILLTEGRAGPDGDRSLYRRPLLLLLSVVGLVMLVACANVAGLSLARSAGRQHEFAVRSALGASRRRLVQQSLTESGLVAFLAGGLGVAIALWGKTAISRLLAGSPDGLHYDTPLDLTVLCFVLATALVTSLFSGLLPALRAASVDPHAELKNRAPIGAPRLRAGRILVAAQLSLSLLLLAVAGLYVRTLVNLVHINPGFATENLLLFSLCPGDAGYTEPRTALLYDRIQESLAAIPGVRSAALTQVPLLGGAMHGRSFTLPGHGGSEAQAHKLIVSETFFTTMGIPLLLGRGLSAADGGGASKVIVVNQKFVHTYLPGENPIGQTIGDDWQIVGVCQDAKYASIKEETPPTVYSSFRQDATGNVFFALRTALPPMSMATAVRKAMAVIDPNIPLTDLGTQEQVRDATIRQERMIAMLCGSLAALAVLLSCIGLYGLMAYQVARRTGEIGVRLALGATRRQIAGPVLREALMLAGIGVAIGTPLTLALTRLIRSNLYGVAPSDPSTIFGAVVLLLAVAVIAAWIPARRASRVDPLIALQYE